MPERATSPIGAPCWADLMTSDPATSEAFYTELFGWTVDDPGPDYGGYKNFMKDGHHVAGFMRNTPEMGTPDVWSVYLASAGAKATTDAATEQGGQVLVEAMDVMDLGRMAVLLDAGQATIGVWEPRDHQGFTLWAETGSPCWFELHTRDYDTSVAFYRSVFGWDTHVMGDTPDFRYTTLGEGEDQKAGIMDASGFLPDGIPAHWSIYWGVDDTDATLARVTELGGSTVIPAENTPYGRLAQAVDPTGAHFKIVQDLG